MPSPAFSLFRPERRETPVIFSSPHSGKDYPAALLLRSPLDELVTRGARIVRMQRCRLAHDAIDLTWHTDSIVEIALSFVTLPEPRGNDRMSYYGGY